MSTNLAIDGAPPARSRPDPPMYPGGMLIGEEEEQAVLEVLRSKRLFRYYGLYEGPSRVAELEEAFASAVGTERALAVTSGTAALICGLQGIGVGPGDEVIVPAHARSTGPRCPPQRQPTAHQRGRRGDDRGPEPRSGGTGIGETPRRQDAGGKGKRHHPASCSLPHSTFWTRSRPKGPTVTLPTPRSARFRPNRAAAPYPARPRRTCSRRSRSSHPGP
jgi:hypothetical protein